MGRKQKREKILERLDQYRAKEIDNLWQRSIFLGTFLVLGFTGYGFIVSKMLSSTEITFYLFEQQKYILKENANSNLQLLHFIACILACINMIFAVLWIAMAKGSKAWYEAYENAINNIELSMSTSYSLVRKSIRLKLVQKNNSFFSTKAGGYSPSKINIALGQISLFIWLTVFIVHLIIIYVNTYEVIDEKLFPPLILIVLFSTIFIISKLTVNNSNKTKWIESSYFSDK